MEEELIYQYYDPNTLLVINAKGAIRTIYTPFRVLCIKGTDNIPVNAWVYVDEVHEDEKHQLLFSISGRQLTYSFFRLVVNF